MRRWTLVNVDAAVVVKSSQVVEGGVTSRDLRFQLPGGPNSKPRTMGMAYLMYKGRKSERRKIDNNDTETNKATQFEPG